MVLLRMVSMGSEEIALPGRSTTTVNRRMSRQTGFALIMTLAMMSLVLGLILTLTAQIRASHREASEKVSAEVARQNAMFAFQVALGELQRTVGADRRLTASAEGLELSRSIENVKWLGVWDAAAGGTPFQRWLVSGDNPQPTEVPTTASVRLVGPGSVGSSTEAFVFADKVSLQGSGDLAGAYAFWIGDESAKADVSMNAPMARITDNVSRDIYNQAPSIAGVGASANDQEEWGRSLINQSQNNRSTFDYLLQDYWNSTVDQDAPEYLSSFDQVAVYPELALIGKPNGSSPSLFHSLATNSAGVMENAIEGGLRFIVDDWLAAVSSGGASRPSYVRTDDILDQPELDEFLNFNRNFSAVLPAGLSIVADGSYRNANLKPILSEAAIYFSVFNRSNYPAMRFYIDAEFYNPYPFPLLVNEGDNRAFQVVFRNLPDLRLEKRRYAADGTEVPGARDSTDWIPMDSIPISRSSGDRWTASWINLDFNPSAFSFPRRFRDRRPYLLPGEVFRVEDPDPASQPQGLWKAIQHAVGVGDRSIGSVSNADTVRVEGRPRQLSNGSAVDGFDIEVYEWRGSSGPRWFRPGTPIFAIRNIPYDAFEYVFSNDPPYLQGSGFSSDIDVSDLYVFAFHFRLGPRWDDPDAADLLESIDLRRPEIDYNGTFVDRDGNTRSYSEFIRIASTNPIDTESNLSAVFPGQDLFSDVEVRSSRDNAFRDIRPYDIPMRDLLSVADLRHLPVDGRPPLALGSVWGADTFATGSVDLNEAFDRYYISTVPSDLSVWSKDDDSALPNPRLLLVQQAQDDPAVGNADLRESDASQYFKVRGAFNLNSTSVDAWHAVLSNEFVGGTNEWAFNQRIDRTIGDRLSFRDDRSDLRNTFFRRPFSAGYEAQPVPDDAFGGGSRLAELSNDLSRDSSMFNSGFRALEGDDASTIQDDQLRHMAWHIVEGIKGYMRDNNHPFRSISDFLESGVIETAIEQAGTVSLTPEMVEDRLAQTSPINDFSVPPPPVGAYPNNRHPSALKQGDVAAQLTPFLSHRSDTFVIRAYGESLAPVTGEVAGRAIIEARVQRLPEKVMPVNANDINSEATADRLGRKFKILSFRWIDPEQA